MSYVDERIFILTSTQKDSTSTLALIEKSGLKGFICGGFDELISNIKTGCGSLLLAKEILISPNLERIRDILEEQESWSHLPVIVLASSGDLTEGNKLAIKMLKMIRNMTVLERPVRMATLTSVLESAIANRKRQYEVRALVKELSEAQKEAVRANESKSEFLANMSHEIRTPLGIILGFAEFAADDRISQYERSQYLTAIKKNGRLLLEIVNDILDLAKVEAGHIAIEAINTPIAEVLSEVVTGFVTVAAEKNIQIDMKLQNGFPDRVKTDPIRVRQIFMNVLGNAIKFTEKGSVHCQATYKKINGKYEIRLKITDTGLGISPEQLKKLFRPFSQADSSMARKYGGTGLGLVLSRKLAQAMDGDIRVVETALNKGSTFEIVLMAEEAGAETSLLKPEINHENLRSIAGLRVLLAEDSMDNQFIISRYLKQVGIEVETAENGVLAVEKASADDFHLILMDIQMPVMDGQKAAVLLRKNGFSNPIIALTANALKGDREKALLSGFDDYITKPIERTELYESLNKFDPRYK